jgi:rod shape-determining protein MreB
LGSASSDKYDPRLDKEMEIVGKQLANGAALPIIISAQEVRQALEPVLAEIISSVRRVIEDASPEVTADIHYSGLTLTGGGSLLDGMMSRLENELSLKVARPADPLTTVAEGAGRLLFNPDQLQRASLRLDAPAWEHAEKLVVNW